MTVWESYVVLFYRNHREFVKKIYKINYNYL